MSVLKICSYPGCNATQKGTRCSTHVAAEWKAFDKDRGSAASRGYDARWRRLRRVVLMREPLCRQCAANGRTVPAACVDHIIPRDAGGPNHIGNLQPLCLRCHGRKTVIEDGGYGRRRKQRDPPT